MNNKTLKYYFKDIDSKLIEPLTILDREHYQAISSRMNVLVEKINSKRERLRKCL